VPKERLSRIFYLQKAFLFFQKQTCYFLKSIAIQSIFNLNIVFVFKISWLVVILVCVDIVGHPGDDLYRQAM